MKIFNRGNAFHTGDLKILKSYMLIGSRNTKDAGISLQVSEIPVDSEQPVHSHAPEQCYYIIRGRGLMIIGDEGRTVGPGDAVHVPPNMRHGMKNLGGETLEYLTANSPAFDEDYESERWRSGPST